MRKHCSSQLVSAKARLFSPAQTFWPSIKKRVGSGQLVRQRTDRRDVSRVLRPILSRIQIPEADGRRSHGFRRGDPPQELKETGAPWSAVAASGMWHSRVRGYVPRR